MFVIILISTAINIMIGQSIEAGSGITTIKWLEARSSLTIQAAGHANLALVRKALTFGRVQSR